MVNSSAKKPFTFSPEKRLSDNNSGSAGVSRHQQAPSLPRSSRREPANARATKQAHMPAQRIQGRTRSTSRALKCKRRIHTFMMAIFVDRLDNNDIIMTNLDFAVDDENALRSVCRPVFE